MVRYACAFTSLEKSLKLRFIKFRVLDAFLATLDMCGDHDNDLFNMIPKIPSRDAGQFLSGDSGELLVLRIYFIELVHV